jgi:hypothetical protein
MALSLKPVIYSPQLNGKGEFVDERVPVLEEGIKCPCSQRDIYFKNSKSFSQHMKTRQHLKWIEYLNTNKQSILQEKTELEETVYVQKKTIARFDNDFQAMMLKIDKLTMALSDKEKEPTIFSSIDITSKSKSIPKSVRDLVWDKYIGEDIPKHSCFCCKTAKITMRDFHAGHIQSRKLGGSSDVTNLRPICHKCNLSMGSQNMIDFIVQHKLFI